MAIYNNGKDLWLYKGDTGNVLISGLPTDNPYTAFMSVYDEDGEKIVDELEAVEFNQTTGVATFNINEEYSNSLKVGEFTYAIKICYNGSEDTVVPETHLENGIYVRQAAPTFTVLSKRVEGE